MLYRIITRYMDENGKSKDWIEYQNTNDELWDKLAGNTDRRKLTNIIEANAKWYGSWIERQQPGEFKLVGYVETHSFNKWTYRGYVECLVKQDDDEITSKIIKNKLRVNNLEDRELVSVIN